MPELPEVETVRRGLAAQVVGRRVADVQVAHPRAVRRHPAGSDDFTARLRGRVPLAASRRGKFLWLALDSGESLLAHLGMSGQLLVVPADAPDGPHLRVRVRFCDCEDELRFVDQRTFGGLAVSAGDPPDEIAHIAPDPLDPTFDDAGFSALLRRRHSAVKRALLDQTLVSGIGNIYADEALWRAGLHWAFPANALPGATVGRLLNAVRTVLAEAILAGGTSFDSLYVNVNGQSGRFDRSLDVYGREDEPCRRCGIAIRRERFTNRSAYFCPRCQPRPRGDARPGVTVA